MKQCTGVYKPWKEQLETNELESSKHLNWPAFFLDKF